MIHLRGPHCILYSVFSLDSKDDHVSLDSHRHNIQKKVEKKGGRRLLLNYGNSWISTEQIHWSLLSNQNGASD